MDTNGTGAAIARALDCAWHTIQERHPDVPDVVLVCSRRRHRSENDMRGQHCHEVWKQADSPDSMLAEVTVFGERFADGGQAVMNTLIHEAVHAYCQVKGLKDTSNRGRYHNKTFARVAREFGLTPPAESGGPAFGFSDCLLPDVIAADYYTAIAALDKVRAHVPVKLELPKAKKPKQYAACQCPEDELISWGKAFQKRFDDGKFLICGVCHSAFEPQEEEE